MTSTHKSTQESSENGEKNIIHFTDSQKNLEESDGEKVTLGPLSKDLAMHLFDLSKKAVEKTITPVTIDASVKCAEMLLKLMKFNLELRKK